MVAKIIINLFQYDLKIHAYFLIQRYDIICYTCLIHRAIHISAFLIQQHFCVKTVPTPEVSYHNSVALIFICILGKNLISCLCWRWTICYTWVTSQIGNASSPTCSRSTAPYATWNKTPARYQGSCFLITYLMFSEFRNLVSDVTS